MIDDTPRNRLVAALKEHPRSTFVRVERIDLEAFIKNTDAMYAAQLNLTIKANTALEDALTKFNVHGYTCGTCSWGRSYGAPFSYAEYQQHVKLTGHDAPKEANK